MVFRRVLGKTKKRRRFDKVRKVIDPYAFLYNRKDNLTQLLNEAYLELGNTLKLDIHNKLVGKDRNFEYADNPLMEFLCYMKDPDNFSFTCKHLLGINILPFQQVILKNLWNYKFPMLIGSRGLSKSFLLGVYCFLRGIFHQNCRIVLTGGSFRQAKIIFEYMEQIWKEATVLHSLFSDHFTKIGPIHGTDRFVFRLGGSEVIAVPLGTGATIRGLRANYIIADEFASMASEVFEVVIRGFGVAASQPQERVKQFAKIEKLKDLGRTQEAEILEEGLGFGNQIILSGTTDYVFNHFYGYWRKYKAFIESKGDLNKIKEIVGDEIPEGFNWRDYCIVRLPYQKLPKGFLDETQIAQAKVTIDHSVFLREYGACFEGNTLIHTPGGLRKISDIRVGDLVLTHKGRFQKVTQTYCRPYYGNVINFRTYGCNQNIRVTPEHLIWSNNQWKEIRYEEVGLQLPKFGQECKINNVNIVDLCDRILYKFANKKIERYNGNVYNLEVENDNSYCVPTGAVHNCWPRDTMGFFKRSLLESCVCRPTVDLGAYQVGFYAKLDGNKQCKHVIGVDPASESDNFAIVVLELSDKPLFRKIVYCWTMTKHRLRNKLKKLGRPTDVNFYSYCARKIRDLSMKFPTDHIGIDAQGGGIGIFEALHDMTQLKAGEVKYWPYVKQGDNDVFWWEKPDKPTDGEVGIHNLHAINFASADFTREANHGLRSDFENKLLLFPCYDALTPLVGQDGEIVMTDDENLEDCYLEIEELKNELSSIIHTQTDSGRDKWSTPEVKLMAGKKGHMRKDRYTAVLIANQIARTLTHEEYGKIPYHFVGGYVGQQRDKSNGAENRGALYVGPSHIVQKISGSYGMGVFRNR